MTVCHCEAGCAEAISEKKPITFMNNEPTSTIANGNRPPQRVAIIGLGLIGGSIGLALKATWPDCLVTGYDIDSEVVEAAAARGVIDQAAPDSGQSCQGAEFVFIATPVPSIPGILATIAPALGAETIVTDVGSTKKRVVEAAETVFDFGVNFIGGHPMAGSEQEGLRAATGLLLKEAVYILTPTSSTSPEAFQKLHALLTRLGARVMALTPARHDEVVASVSHLPHVLAAALVNMVSAVEEGVENRLLFAAGGFRDTTRIAAGSPRLWADICLENKDALARSIDSFIQGLTDFKDEITAGDRSALLRRLVSAKDSRVAMAIDETPAGARRELDVLVSDRPGTISQITLTFGQLGINVEDIQIVPLSGDRGIIKLLVDDSANLSKALTQLREYGFDVIEK
jgi:prephenate dehydrogenase